ncbi:MAG: DNA-3-methyladenine glycosylase I [Acidobacteria bacterium]|nr:MAG: DNA-3-methyladenine glycosylase I [Acidobacteriota bacterium]
MSGAKRAADGRPRCAWPSSDISIAYHDREWGVPLKDDRKLFEFLVLDAAQAGLSWEIILRKREGFRAAFDDFDPEKIARYDERKIKELLADTRIIRNRLKIESAIGNARAFLAVQKECGSFASYIWQFVGGKPKINARRSLKDIPATSTESDAMSQALKKRGFRFVGSTICYAFMQAAGMVNDHAINCFRHAELTRRMQRWRIRYSEIQ